MKRLYIILYGLFFFVFGVVTRHYYPALPNVEYLEIEPVFRETGNKHPIYAIKLIGAKTVWKKDGREIQHGPSFRWEQETGWITYEKYIKRINGESVAISSTNAIPPKYVEPYIPGYPIPPEPPMPDPPTNPRESEFDFSSPVKE